MFGRLTSGLSALTNGIAAAMLAAMFIAFLLQIFSRYVLQEPFGWTLELCLILWVWIVFFGCAFNVREKEHVTFDLFYLAAPRRLRRILALISAGAVAAGMAWAFLPTWDYVDWMKMRRTSTVENPFTGDHIRLKWIFVIYSVFMAVLILRYAWRFGLILRKGPPDHDHEQPGHDPKPPPLQHGEDVV